MPEEHASDSQSTEGALRRNQTEALPPERVPIIKAKTQSLVPDQILGDERLDPYRARITIGLIALLFLALLAHAGLTMWASRNSTDAAKDIAAVFNVWVPVISGLASSAVTWFFTRQK